MTTKQVKFFDSEGDKHGGIYVKDGSEEYIICGCCGGVFMVGEDVKRQDITFLDWISIEDGILGDLEDLED